MDTEHKEVEPPKDEDILPSEGDVYGVREKPEQTEDKEERKVSPTKRVIDAKAPSKKAFIKDQAEKYPDSVQLSGIDVKVLDLGKECDLETYSSLKTQAADPDLGLTIGYEAIEWDKNSSNWKVLIHIHQYNFLPVV